MADVLDLRALERRLRQKWGSDVDIGITRPDPAVLLATLTWSGRQVRFTLGLAPHPRQKAVESQLNYRVALALGATSAP